MHSMQRRVRVCVLALQPPWLLPLDLRFDPFFVIPCVPLQPTILRIPIVVISSTIVFANSVEHICVHTALPDLPF